MKSNETTIKENSLYRKIGTTLYEISVKESENAKESASDILVRLIATDMEMEENNG